MKMRHLVLYKLAGFCQGDCRPLQQKNTGVYALYTFSKMRKMTKNAIFGIFLHFFAPIQINAKMQNVKKRGGRPCFLTFFQKFFSKNFFQKIFLKIFLKNFFKKIFYKKIFFKFFYLRFAKKQLIFFPRRKKLFIFRNCKRKIYFFIFK